VTTKTIVPFGDPILRKRAKPAEVPLSPKLSKVLDDMIETLYAAEGRAGLAAPQVGYLRRLIVMDCGDGLIELINPVMTAMSGEQDGTEACLSFPGYYGRVKRAHRVTVSTMNRDGEKRLLEAEGYLARCIQHEIDHLNGILFIDHVKDKWLYHEQTGERVSVMETLKLSNQVR
jgi:peptide deformylase